MVPRPPRTYCRRFCRSTNKAIITLLYAEAVLFEAIKTETQKLSVSLLVLCVLADVPSHLHYIMLELIKNSMRATVDFHGLDEMDNNPIRVVIADGESNEVGEHLSKNMQ